MILRLLKLALNLRDIFLRHRENNFITHINYNWTTETPNTSRIILIVVKEADMVVTLREDT